MATAMIESAPAMTEAETAIWESEKAAFRAMLPELLRTHAEQYVAVHHGRVVASGTDKTAVALAAYETCGYLPIPVLLVTDGPPRIVHLSGTPIGTPEML
ncbi:MAG TPA: hypothetical protein VD866_15835 [Urbifossiella sp.]|nr:hypothetical protein [Urbifossiella sp.]